MKIWTQIKNIYNVSPWHAAFTYPISYIFIAYVFVGIFGAVSASLNFEYTFLIYISIFLMFSTYLTPIWVFVGLIVSNKKKPYVLSLIIGLGLLFILFYVVNLATVNLEVK
ncbi:hypothetical protein N9U90_03670 [Candidatus Pelagibacter sp.]|nr:hypothetical protein [Candidatus Pelagibacter sp.]